MAKHDQRILKFLTQNAERTPTITDMMTRLNISISDITASLNSLMAQGMVSKRTNAQGIECWFPSNGAPAQPAVESALEPRSGGGESRVLPGLNHPAPPEPSPLPPLQPTLPSLSASNAFPASLTASSAPPPPGLRVSPSSESAVFTAPTAAMPAASNASGYSYGTAAPASQPQTPAPPTPAAQPPLETLPGITPPVGGYGLAPVKSGVGMVTFLLGLLVAGAGSVFVAMRLLKQDLDKATKGFVEKSALDEASKSWTAFQNSTKTHVTALETQVKALEGQLAAMKATNDSLQTLVAKSAAEAKKAESAVSKKAARRKR